MYHLVEIKHNTGLLRFLEFDFGAHNRTRLAGLENDLANCYINPLIQVHAVPLLVSSSRWTAMPRLVCSCAAGRARSPPHAGAATPLTCALRRRVFPCLVRGQALYYLPHLRTAALGHLCDREICMLCEMAFLFHMLGQGAHIGGGGKTCQASAPPWEGRR